MKPVYLDYNATTPLDPEVAESMRPFLDGLFGNPSSDHWYGTEAKKAVEKARGQVARLLGCRPEEIIFTSGGSESDNMAIKGAAFANREAGNHIITSSVEHPAVLEVCRYLEDEGFLVTYLEVDRKGKVNPGDLRKAISPRTILVTVMMANNEVGTIQPIGEISRITSAKEILLHTDAAQAVGKIPVDVNELGVDMLTVAGHKLYAPKGVGALYLRSGVQLSRLIHGADHEQNLRAGTENVMEIAGLGTACEVAGRSLDEEGARMRALRDRLYRGLKKNHSGIRLNGDPKERLPNTLSVGIPGIEASTLLAELDGVAASPGAACHTGSVDISETLKAMGTPVEYAIGTVRFSTGRFSTEDEIDRAVRLVSEAVKRLVPSTGSDGVTEQSSRDLKLTHFTHGLGCACKLRPHDLEKVLREMPVPVDPEVMIGPETLDDAAVYRINEDTALVQTLDFFTPVLDDPYDFGAVAAANALSDIYAMGANPVFALNIVGFPSSRLPMEVLRLILKGAGDKAAEAGVSILGGHTVEDSEPKFGLAVTGLVHPGRILTNSGASAGDALILTKPLGTGILSTALKRGMLEEEMERKLTLLMSELNRKAAEVIARYDVTACTDVTGFGFLGHLREMTAGGGATAEVDAGRVPVMDGVRQLIAAGVVPGGTVSNLEYVSGSVEWGEGVSRVDRIVLADAQTSGGLLVSVPGPKGQELREDLREGGVTEAEIVGKFIPGGKKSIRVVAR
ncbi:MAG: selenide, water dikinase SelD [Candidatus Latescibacteria bacterium]|nr:selenide, water dikinase SelD [bacterium]MBD3423392.1 selenide, water dikinase SelD [Candidatus Latescibacterota bacterium]